MRVSYTHEQCAVLMRLPQTRAHSEGRVRGESVGSEKELGNGVKGGPVREVSRSFEKRRMTSYDSGWKRTFRCPYNRRRENEKPQAKLHTGSRRCRGERGGKGGGGTESNLRCNSPVRPKKFQVQFARARPRVLVFPPLRHCASRPPPPSFVVLPFRD